MRKPYLVVLIAVLLLGASAPDNKVAARHVLADATDRALAENEPEWFLTRTVEDLKGFSKTWKPTRDQGLKKRSSPSDREEEMAVEVQARAADSEDEAVDDFKRSLLSISIGSGDKVEGLGDEGYEWVNYNRRGRTRRFFRRSNYVVSVAGPSADVTERFSRHVLNAVEDTIDQVPRQ